MLRIAHVSDLHFQSADLPDQQKTLLQRLTSGWVKAEGHDRMKLGALETALVSLRPDVIVVTGDLTNLGDDQSFDEVVAVLRSLKKASGARQVLCIPGNHDCLVDRAEYLERGLAGKALVRFLAWALAPIARAKRAAETSPKSTNRKQRRRIRERLAAEAARNGMVFFDRFLERVAASEFGEVNPARPVEVDARWGKALFFLFNSNNDSELMANEGRVGAANFNRLNRFLEAPQKQELFEGAVRIALLHHHPISAPQDESRAPDRFYDWMRDGPRFLEYLNRRRFHFVLHGHQHLPFTCSVDYTDGHEGALHIVAAGSATQGSDPTSGSFNLIDLVTPFEAWVRRYDYERTGFRPSPFLDRLWPIRPLSEVRWSSPGSPEMPEDLAVRHLFRGRREGIDQTREYELLDFDVVIDRTQLYQASYRRRGTVRSEEPDPGPIFVITGSPRMDTEAMQLSAHDNLHDCPLSIKILQDDGLQKVIRVLHRLELKQDDSFDLTLKFRWQATPSEPHDFDGLNLMYFRHPIAKLSYSVELPWRPAQPKVRGHGISEVRVPRQESVEPLDSGRFAYRFQIDQPPPLAYLIDLRERL